MDDTLETPIQTISSAWPETGSSTFDFEEAKVTIFLQKNNDQNSDKKLNFKIIIDSYPDHPFSIKIMSVAINKDSSKNIEKTNIVQFRKSQTIAYFSFDFPINEIDDEHGWLINGEFNIKTNFCLESQQNNNNGDYSSGSSDATSHDSDSESDSNESFEAFWLISNYSVKPGIFKSEIYNIGPNKIHFEAIRVKSNLTNTTPFQVDILVDEITEKHNIKISVTVMNQNQNKNRKCEKDVELLQNGDRAVITFPDLMQSELTIQNGYIKDNQLMIIVRLSGQDEDDGDVNRIKLTGNNYDYYNNNAYNYSYNNSNYTYHDTSKEKTGYVGLLNQGATCYMNSMLQSLYHTPVFRKLIYEIPTVVDENEATNVILNIQRLFAMMQFSDKACSTKALTKSFGWDSHRTFIQHDTQEFLRVLIDNIEEKIKNDDKLKDGIAKILRGQIRNYIRCKNVDFESSRTEYFLDLSMTVKGCPTLEDSFKKYTEKEELVDDNQYDTGNPSFGKQDALMGCEFLAFPPVLHLHLRRFEYDYEYDRNIKINDRFEFPKEINLEPFLAKDGDRTKSSIYDLYGVLVHSGSVSYGHYYAFLRTSTDPQWFEFNDTSVSKVDEQKAINDNFGGGPQTKSFSAYLLVYVRREDAPNIFEKIPEDIIPQHIRDYVENPEKVVKVSSSTTKSTDKTVSSEPIKKDTKLLDNEKKEEKNESQYIDEIDVNGVKLKTLPHFQIEKENDEQSKEISIVLFDYENCNVPVSLIKANTKTNIKDLIQFIAKSRNLNYDTEKDSFLLYSKDYFYDRPSTSPLSLKIHTTLFTIVNMYKSDNIYFMYYRYLPGITESDMENKLLLSINLSIDGCSIAKKTVILVPKTAKGYEVLDAAFEKIDLNEFNIDQNSLISEDNDVKYKNVRLMPIKSSKIVKFSSLKSTLGVYYTEYRIDIIPQDQLNLKDGEMVVLFSTAAVNNNNQPVIYGIPFFMKLKKDITIEQIKLILKDKLDIDEKEFPKLKLFQAGEYVTIIPKYELKNDKILGQLDLKIGIFVVKNMHRVGGSGYSRKKEEALKIDN